MRFKCPSCKKYQSPEALIPNSQLRDAVNRHLRQQEQKRQMDARRLAERESSATPPNTGSDLHQTMIPSQGDRSLPHATTQAHSQGGDQWYILFYLAVYLTSEL